jgi:hypothetical protein
MIFFALADDVGEVKAQIQEI